MRSRASIESLVPRMVPNNSAGVLSPIVFDMDEHPHVRYLRKQAEYRNRISAASITFVILIFIVGLPSQNGWIAFIAASVASGIVYSVMKQLQEQADEQSGN